MVESELIDTTADDPLPGSIQTGAVQQIPALTILDHPDVRRIGEVALLQGLLEDGSANLSRVEPIFCVPGGDSGSPLGGRFLSRTPIRLEKVATSIRIVVPDHVELEAGGPEERSFSAREIADGVVLEVARRVVLLLHRTSMPLRVEPRLGLVGDSEALEYLRADVVRVADLDVPVLLRGESGTGKELVARAIHEHGHRSRGPCVCLNMAAIPPSTAASELFGHAPGAFTGATREHVGHIARADGGTLFLDEIGEMPLEVQSMLLRVLETQEVQPLGGQRSRKVDARLVAATDANLEEAIASGRFREPLFHRLAGYQIVIPPLRRRRDDIGRLIRHFMEEEIAGQGSGAEVGPDGERRPRLPPRIIARMARHSWPGNVRQLRNVARQLFIAMRGPPGRSLDATAGALLGEPERPGPNPPQAAEADAPAREVSEEELIAALRKNRWRTSRAADELGISRTTLYALIDRSTRIRKARDIPKEELARCLEECKGDLDAASTRLEVSKRALQLRLREQDLI